MDNFSGFYKIDAKERIEKIKKYANLTDEEVEALKNTGALDLERADRMVENVIGAIHLPLGLATHFTINGKEMVIPMAVEEPSVIAAACKAAKQTLPKGFVANADEPIMMGQIQLVDVPDIGKAKKKLDEKRDEIIKVANEYMTPHAKWGAKEIGRAHV